MNMASMSQEVCDIYLSYLLFTNKHVITIAYLNNTILSSVSDELPQMNDIYNILRTT